MLKNESRKEDCDYDEQEEKRKEIDRSNGLSLIDSCVSASSSSSSLFVSSPSTQERNKRHNNARGLSVTDKSVGTKRDTLSHMKVSRRTQKEKKLKRK